MKLTQAEMIQVLRRRINLNQGDFGSRAFDTSHESGRTKIKNIELGKQIPTVKDLKKMAAVLGVDYQVLLTPDAVNSGAVDSLVVDPELETYFPGLEAYLSMLDKAVRIGDGELIAHIAHKLAAIFGSVQKDRHKKQMQV